MATTLNVPPSTQILVSENWDDDFEFQQDLVRSHRRHVGVAEARKASITSTALEDWDADEDPTSPSSTTSQAVLNQHVERQTDNWDDDFEDGRNSPKKVVVVVNTMTTSPNSRRMEESWDDDVDLGDETDEEGKAEFGFAEKEEDRTVTAKSRRAALKRLSSPSNQAPPPMPPPLPSNFLLNLSQQPAQHGPYRTFQQPFPPRSPTSSVFSVPTTAHTTQTHDHYYSSTTHLRPTSAFALLPPSPPIHKERERRRLRKKSRPKPQGTFELASLRGSSPNGRETRLGTSDFRGTRYSLSDEGDVEPSTSEQQQPRQTPIDTSSSADDRRAFTPALMAPPLPQTPGKGSALLSRIGSVKKWGARRKRASTTPSEVVIDNSNNIDPHRTPRAKSSRASFHANLPSGRNSMSTPPPPRDPTTSTSNSESAANNHRPSQRSNWFFRASSAGSPHTRAGGRAGGGTSSKGDRGKEETAERADDEGHPTSRQRSESANRRRSRSRTGRVGSSYLNGNGSRTDVSNAHISVPSTPSKLVKRKSMGFIQLGRAISGGKENDEKRIAEPEINDSPRKERYVGIGLGRATTSRGINGEACERHASESEGAIQHGDGQENRARRKSFSRFLFDRDKEDARNASSKGEVPEKERDGSRGFMGSVRRISLVGGGRHKRTKSGSGILVSIGEGGKPPPLPSSPLLTHRPKPPSKQLPYLLPLPVTSSQLSLRLPSPSSYLPGKQPYNQTGSMHDLPSAFSLSTLPFSRTPSGASTQTQASSNTSSVLPLSSVSSRSSRNTTGSEQQTPLPPQRKASTRSRASEESARPRKSTSSRRSLDVKITNDVSFVTRLSQSGKNESDIALQTLPQQPNSFVVPSPSPPLATSSSAPPLLPPIELQPPSPPRTITKGPKPESKSSNILTTFDSSSTSKLSTSASSSSVFFTPSSSPQRQPIGCSASPNSKTNKLHVPLSPKSPHLLQQSASLGRATTAGSSLSDSPQDGSGSNADSTHPRRNSLGDLKIPARISQAQVGLRRDLGMVKEFANNVEQLKELQRIHDALVVEIQSILDAYVIRHEQQQAQQTFPIPTALTYPLLPDTTGFLSLKPKKRPRSNTNPGASRSETNAVTPAQVSHNELASAFYLINSKYRITWECAELLIELGAGSANGTSNDDFSSPPASASAPIVSQLVSAAHGLGSIGTKRGRERAITLAGDESKPTQPQSLVASYSVPRSPDADLDSLVSSPSNGPASSMSWRTSTGRHDLSQRQVVLLREMLNNAHAHSNVADTNVAGANSQTADTPISETSVLTSRSHTQPRMLYAAVNNEWKWGDPKNSTVTLPEEGDRVDNGRKASTDRKRRSGKLGMSGLRDLLRALKRGAIVEESTMPAALPIHSTTSLSTESSVGSKRLRKSRQPSQRRKLRTGMVPDSNFSATETAKGQEREPRSPYGPSFVAAKPSPRRPSLASVFRIGSKHRPSNTTNEAGPVSRSELVDDEIPAQTGGGTTAEDSSSAEEDWDRMDSASDLDTAAKALCVVDGSETVRVGRQCNGRKASPYFEQAPEQSEDRRLITKRSFGASQASIRCMEYQSLDNNSSQSGNVPPPPRAIRLSNVEEHADDHANANTINAPSSMRSVSQTHSNTQQAWLHKSGVTVSHSHPTANFNNKSGSVRSMPVVASATVIDPKPPLAMTPENIKPLLENAREVQARLGDCISELRLLVSRSVETAPGDT